MSASAALPITEAFVPSLPEDRALLGAPALSALGRQAARLQPIVGAEGSSAALVARFMALSGAEHLLVIVADLDDARRMVADLSFFAQGAPGIPPLGPPVPDGQRPLLVVPSESSPWSEVHSDRRAAAMRVAALAHLADGQPWRFLVTTAAGLVRRVVPKSVLAGNCTRVVTEGEIDLTSLVTTLTRGGYLRVPIVEDPGTFAVRGGLLDVWPPSSEQPTRIELYGDLVASLKVFDPDDQQTVGTTESLWIPPVSEAILGAEHVRRARDVVRSLCDAVDHPSSKARGLVEDVAEGRVFFGMEGYLPAYYELEALWSLLPEHTKVVVEEPARVVKALRAELGEAAEAETSMRGKPHFSFASLYATEREVFEAFSERSVVLCQRAGVLGSDGLQGPLDAWESVPADAPSLVTSDHAGLQRAVHLARTNRGKAGALEPLLVRLEAWREAGLVTAIAARSQTQAERLASLLRHRGVRVSERDADGIRLLVGALARGVVAPTLGFALVTEEEVFGQRAHRRVERKKTARSVLEDLRALEPGDYVVHVEHGIGRYVGLQRQEVAGASVELLVVEYAGGKLFLPVYRLNQIQKYSGGEGAPKLDRLGGASFAKTKSKVARRVRQMADQLLELYAERAALVKVPIDPVDEEYHAFEATFPYEETRDQAAAIKEVLADLESSRVMDRLVCGDVGFGKTEVALRAAFRVAMSGRQVALLCPTTVLAQQHFATFTARLSGYPIEVRVLSRFASKQIQVETSAGLRDGTVDIVIGTHRLLSKDVHFANLGLLVVDEEQRFGVTHKERIKQLRASVDVLTLTATPIPRTLQLAVGGLREMSLITTPPEDRRAIRTITSRWDEQVVREAIDRELSRGGQVFYVYNRVEGLYERAARLAELCPNARVAIGHGQLSEAALERTMLDFVEGRYDVLVSTAIVESGIDIPRANTILIDRADLFGLSQLYQLRGRVGRSSERAYCYLLVPAPSQMSEESRSRIEALERHTELGSGFHVATLDMELRGAGDLLGADQSGFVASVGFEMFCQMLEEAAQELRGETVEHAVDPDLTVDVEALLPADYVEDVGVRLSLYKRLASAHDESGVQDLAVEMEDRFGPPPAEARRFIELMRLKTELRRLRVLACEASRQSVTLHLRDDTPLDPARVGALVGRKGTAYRIAPDGRLSRRTGAGEGVADGLGALEKMLSELATAERSAS
ncbi:MAG: transcription-repair coupling factor [Polyangiaceae bacterium]|nr:transcription-repair coupling factor [Polyangiaceae bacterium]